MNDFAEALKNSNFEKRLQKLAKKYKNKKVVFYGTGQFYQYVKENYDLSCFDVIALSDKKFMNITSPVYNNELGCDVISPLKIYELKPDVVLISAYVDFYIEKYFCEDLFVNTKHKFKYAPLYERSWGEKVQEAWNLF